MNRVDHYYFTLSVDQEANEASLYVQFYGPENQPIGTPYVERINLFCMTWKDVAQWIVGAAALEGFDVVLDASPSPFVHLR